MQMDICVGAPGRVATVDGARQKGNGEGKSSFR